MGNFSERQWGISVSAITDDAAQRSTDDHKIAGGVGGRGVTGGLAGVELLVPDFCPVADLVDVALVAQ